MIPTRGRWALLAATVWLAGCGLLPGTGSGPGFQGTASCSELPGGACQEQLDLAAARHPEAVQLDLSCTVAACTRAGGAGTVTVTLPGGATVTEAFSYTGDPAPLPAPVCTGVAPDVCRQVATSTADDFPPSQRVAAITITCTVASCTEDRGEATVVVRFADDSTFRGHRGWGGPP